MQIWDLVDYAAWGVSALLGLYLVADWLKTDRSYPEEVLTSSREGELEAMTEERRS